MILDKMRSSSSKSVVRFRSYGLIGLFNQNNQTVVSMAQAQNLQKLFEVS